MLEKFHLVATKLASDSVPDGAEPIFLGEWCGRQDGKKIRVVKYHWDDRDKLKKDFIFIDGVYENLLRKLTSELNKIHNVNYSINYWRVFIGPWLRFFIEIVFDRWSMIVKSIEDVNIIDATVAKKNILGFIPLDMEEFIDLMVTDDWNEFVFGEILELVDVKKRYIEVIDKNASIKNQKKMTIKGLLKQALNLLSTQLNKKSSIFLIGTYLSAFDQLRLQCGLRQFPQIWSSFRPLRATVNLNLRELKIKFDQEIKFNELFFFEKIVCAFAIRHMPIVYLEGYESLIDKTKKNGWPKNIKSIFTSNSFIGDDVFKQWAAYNISRGSKLITAQHGGGYGMMKFFSMEDHQIKISDKFLTWGWSKLGVLDIKPLGSFFKRGIRSSIKNKGHVLIIEGSVPRFSICLSSQPIGPQWRRNFDDINLMIENLRSNIRREVVLRLYSTNYGWYREDEVKERFKDITIDPGRKKIDSLIDKSILCVCTYNSTAILELLRSNIPTIIVWDERYWELNSEASDCFEKLKLAGIFYTNPIYAAQKINEIFDDVGNWWGNPYVQEARREFCKQYSVVKNDLCNEILQELIN